MAFYMHAIAYWLLSWSPSPLSPAAPRRRRVLPPARGRLLPLPFLTLVIAASPPAPEGARAAQLRFGRRRRRRLLRRRRKLKLVVKLSQLLQDQHHRRGPPSPPFPDSSEGEEQPPADASGGEEQGKPPKKRRIESRDDRSRNNEVAGRTDAASAPRTKRLPVPGMARTTPLPDRQTLDMILDKLQKKDTYGVFAEPVDLEELPDYNDVIEHPMDFGTFKRKLARDAYRSFGQFEDMVHFHSLGIFYPFLLDLMFTVWPGAVVKYSPLVPTGPGFDAASLHCTVQCSYSGSLQRKNVAGCQHD